MSRLHPDIAKAAREAHANVVALSPAGAVFFRGPVGAADALALLDQLPGGTPAAPVWIEWYAVPEVRAV